MNKFLFAGIFAIGAIVVLWISGIFIGTDLIGLAVTLLIGIVYLIGVYELYNFGRSTHSLNNAIKEPVSEGHSVDAWVDTIAADLQGPIRLRINGDRVPFAAPALTPYLVGLLVMLGLLGTFIGMVDTLKGAVTALEGTTELEAIRAGLAAPIGGLGLAFGTSVAGVAASAVLGLLSTIIRRERVLSSQQLDQIIAANFAEHSSAYQQRNAFKAIQEQAAVMPKVADKLTKLSASLENMADTVATQLQDNQLQFQDRISALYTTMNQSLDQSLKSTLRDTVKEIGDGIQPLAESAFKQLSASAEKTQSALQEVNQTQLSSLQSLASKQQDEMNKAMSSNLKQQSKSLDNLLSEVGSNITSVVSEVQQSGSDVAQTFDQMSRQWGDQQVEYADQMGAVLKQELASIREQESDKADVAVAKLGALEAMVAEHLTMMGLKLEEPMTQLIETASETPKAAAEVITKLRDEMTNNLARDNELLEERTRLMSQLDALSTTLSNNSVEQRDAIEKLIIGSSTTLSAIGEQFGEHLASESEKMAVMADSFASNGIELSSWGEAFQAAVQNFSESNNLLVENLNRIETSLAQSNERSGEQLAYYVAQAREIIDHNLLSHQKIISALNTQQPTQLTVEGVES